MPGLLHCLMPACHETGAITTPAVAGVTVAAVRALAVTGRRLVRPPGAGGVHPDCRRHTGRAKGSRLRGDRGDSCHSCDRCVTTGPRRHALCLRAEGGPVRQLGSPCSLLPRPAGQENWHQPSCAGRECRSENLAGPPRPARGGTARPAWRSPLRQMSPDAARDTVAAD
jgi:hypothetical protein